MKFPIFYIFLIPITTVFSQESAQISSLSYPESIFNSDTCCWRKLSAAGQDEDAGHLILAYYEQNKKTANKQALLWHAGQCFAMAGENELAKKYIRKTYIPFFKWFGGEEGRTWYYYANGTVAFIERDKKTLSAMIDKWGRHYAQDINYQALVELLKHWDVTYKEINKKKK